MEDNQMRRTKCLALVMIFAATGCANKPNGAISKPAPDFTLKTIDGKQVQLSAQKGNVVLVDFWATWCPPCRESLPHVQKVSADEALAKKGLIVFAINDKEDSDTVKKFLADNKYTFTVPMDADQTAVNAYSVTGIPTTVIVGRDGNIADVFVGFADDSRGTDRCRN